MQNYTAIRVVHDTIFNDHVVKRYAIVYVGRNNLTATPYVFEVTNLGAAEFAAPPMNIVVNDVAAPKARNRIRPTRHLVGYDLVGVNHMTVANDVGVNVDA
jgi:hypothetical protein